MRVQLLPQTFIDLPLFLIGTGLHQSVFDIDSIGCHGIPQEATGDMSHLDKLGSCRRSLFLDSQLEGGLVSMMLLAPVAMLTGMPHLVLDYQILPSMVLIRAFPILYLKSCIVLQSTLLNIPTQQQILSN